MHYCSEVRRFCLVAFVTNPAVFEAAAGLQAKLFDTELDVDQEPFLIIV